MSSGRDRKSIRFLTLVLLPCRLELLGCREGQLCGHWEEG